MRLTWSSLPGVLSLLLSTALSGCGGGGVDPSSDPASTAAAAPSAAKQAQAFRSATTFNGNGWYWNAAEPGTGFMVEAQGEQAFVGFFMYEPGSGKPVWYAAYGVFFADDAGNHYLFGDLRRYGNGQSISAATVPPFGNSASLGAVSINFPAAGGASVLLPGGRSIAATRFSFNGLDGTPRPNQPETGWYWNPAEGGRGYAIEVQNDQLFMAMFHYNEDGSPTWNIVKGDISSGVLSAPFITYDGGQSLAAAFVPGGTENLRGPFTLAFANPCAGQVQRAGVRATAIRRFPIPGSTLAPGAECRAMQTLADVPPAARPLDVSAALTATQLAGVPALPRLQPGDAVFGKIDAAGDADMYAVLLTAGVPYRFSAKGAPSGSGSLPDPFLVLYSAEGISLGRHDDISASNLDALLTYTPATTGLYLLTVMPAFTVQTGTFVLAIDGGVAAELDAAPVKPLADFAGTFNGLLRGSDRGSFALALATDGTIGGSVTLASAPGTPLPARGTVQPGGVFQLTAGPVTAIGYLGPQGDLSGTWSSASGTGGVFIGDRSNTNVLRNQAPTAAIVNSPTFVFSRALTLAAGTFDANGDPLTYRWRLVSSPEGSTASIVNPTIPNATLNANARGPYVVALTVNDGKTDGVPVYATLTAVGSNVLPVANAGLSRTVALGSVVTLDGRGSTDPDSPLSYRWSIVEQPSGGGTVAFTPEMAASVQPLFVAQSAGVFVVRLTVSDEQSVSTDEVSITVLPPEGAPPVAQAPQNVAFTGTGSSVSLAGRWAARSPVSVGWGITGIFTDAGGVGGPPQIVPGQRFTVSNNFAARIFLTLQVSENTNPARIASASAQVNVVDLSGNWVGTLGVSGLSSSGIGFTTNAGGALTGTMNVTFQVCGQFQARLVRFAAPVRLFDATGNRATFLFGDTMPATLTAELSSATTMSGTLSLDIAATSPTCGPQTVVLPWQATKV